MINYKILEKNLKLEAEDAKLSKIGDVAKN